MYTSILAHGGKMTGDEIAIVGGGLFVAFAVPVAALLIAMRRRNRTEPAQSEGGDEPLWGSEIR
ncbi:MAG: hypothetical protein ACOYEV_19235 [Candidatus Nanopelagicales bacterium]